MISSFMHKQSSTPSVGNLAVDKLTGVRELCFCQCLDALGPVTGRTCSIQEQRVLLALLA